MNIKCDKCNNEFFVRLDIHTPNVYNVRCPVCKNPITIKIDSNDTVFRKHSETSDNYRANKDSVHSNPNLVSSTDNFDTTAEQLQGDSDSMILETNDEFYSNMELPGSDKKDSLISIIKALISRINILDFTNKSFYYVYYSFIFFLILIFLFEFSDIIKINGLGASIDHFFRSLISVFIHYV